MEHFWLIMKHAMDMNGYNQYVWPAYGVAMVVLTYIAIRPVYLKRRLRKLIKSDASCS